MTIEELEETLPNGFHDSQIVSISVNFLVGTCCIELDVDHDDPDPDVFKRMKLQLKEVFGSARVPGPEDWSFDQGHGLGKWAPYLGNNFARSGVLPKECFSKHVFLQFLSARTELLHPPGS